jgi:hypothetical protein
MDYGSFVAQLHALSARGLSESHVTVLSHPSGSVGARLTGQFHSLHLAADILFSDVYECPVLYFQLHDDDGNRLLLDDYLALESTPTTTVTLQVTEGPHPWTQQPYLYVHPCQTNVLLHELKTTPQMTDAMLFRAWLAVYGSACGLNGFMITSF